MNSIIVGTLFILGSIVDEWNVSSKYVDVVRNIHVKLTIKTLERC